MPKLFLSHSSNDKPLVTTIYQQLHSAFLSPWMDKTHLYIGDRLEEEIFPAIEASDFFVPFFSDTFGNKTVEEKDWCIREYKHALKHKKTTLPIILLKEGELFKSGRFPKWFEQLPAPIQKDAIDKACCIHNYNLTFTNMDKAIRSLSNSVSKAAWGKEEEVIVFKPIDIKYLAGQPAHFIEFDFVGHLPEEVLDTIKEDMNVERLLKEDTGTGHKFGTLPIIFSGTSVNWLLTYLTIPLFNKVHSIWVYNRKFNKAVCVYELNPPKDKEQQLVGKVKTFTDKP